MHFSFFVVDRALFLSLASLSAARFVDRSCLLVLQPHCDFYSSEGAESISLLVLQAESKARAARIRRLPAFSVVGALGPLKFVRREREREIVLFPSIDVERKRRKRLLLSSPWSSRGQGRPCWRHYPCQARTPGLRRPFLLERGKKGESKKEAVDSRLQTLFCGN